MSVSDFLLHARFGKLFLVYMWLAGALFWVTVALEIHLGYAILTGFRLFPEQFDFILLLLPLPFGAAIVAEIALRQGGWYVE